MALSHWFYARTMGWLSGLPVRQDVRVLQLGDQRNPLWISAWEHDWTKGLIQTRGICSGQCELVVWVQRQKRRKTSCVIGSALWLPPFAPCANIRWSSSFSPLTGDQSCRWRKPVWGLSHGGQFQRLSSYFVTLPLVSVISDISHNLSKLMFVFCVFFNNYFSR